ncbi:MAG: hypothetical protein MPN21_02805 [Thermoanaerobaculia bacterium]|nr:hypothetical protein [Thermoanaerobaculia bacterium]
MSESTTEPRYLLQVAHLFVGIAGLLAFAATGQFMHHQLDHLVGMADGPRALFRSAHIYLLFCALLHFVLGLHLGRSSGLAGRAIQWLGSGLLFAAFAGFLFGFYVETAAGEVERPIVRMSIYCCFAGALVHGLERLLSLSTTAPS